MTPDDAVWEDIRVAYETTSETKREIAVRFGINERSIYPYAKRHGWTLRPSGIDALLIAGAKRAAGITSTRPPPETPKRTTTRTAAAGRKTPSKGRTLDIASPIKPRKEAGSDTHQIAIIKRLYDVTDAKLGAIEERIEKAAPLSRADADREAREIAGILKTIEKLKDLSDAFARTAAKSGETSASAEATAALVDDAERLRQDLAERFERLKVGEGDAPPAA